MCEAQLNGRQQDATSDGLIAYIVEGLFIGLGRADAVEGRVALTLGSVEKAY